QRGASRQKQRLRSRARARRDPIERLARLAQIDAIVFHEGALEPDLAEGSIEQRVVLSALERGAERQDRAIPVMRARVRQAARDLAGDAIAIEAGEHLQLLELIGLPPELAVEIGQLLARDDQRRRQRHGALERLDRFASALAVAQADALQVVDVG